MDSLAFSYVGSYNLWKESYSSSFPVWIPLILKSCLIALTSTSSASLNIADESGHPYLVPDLGGKAFFFSPLSITLACSFHNCLYNFEELSFHSLFSRVFIMKRHWVLSSAFSVPFERFRWLFTLCSVTVLYYIDALVLNHASIPGVNPIWSWCILLLICLLNCVC